MKLIGCENEILNKIATLNLIDLLLKMKISDTLLNDIYRNSQFSQYAVYMIKNNRYTDKFGEIFEINDLVLNHIDKNVI